MTDWKADLANLININKQNEYKLQLKKNNVDIFLSEIVKIRIRNPTVERLPGDYWV